MVREMLTGRNVVEIRRDTFPIDTPVVVRSFCDTRAGWEYDAPLHIMEPFHGYRIISSICDEVVNGIVEDILVDLELGRIIAPDSDCWPYSPAYLKRLWRQGKSGNSDRLIVFETTVVVRNWGTEEKDWRDSAWSIETTEIQR